MNQHHQSFEKPTTAALSAELFPDEEGRSSTFRPESTIVATAKFYRDFGFRVIPCDTTSLEFSVPEDWPHYPADTDIAAHFDARPDDGICTVLPAGLVGFQSHGPDGAAAIIPVVMALDGPPCVIGGEGSSLYLYRQGEGWEMLLSSQQTSMPDVVLLTAGAVVALPCDRLPSVSAYGSLIDIPIVDREEVVCLPIAGGLEDSANAPPDVAAESMQASDDIIEPASRTVPSLLEKYSLRGCGDELAENAQPPEPFLDGLALKGQATVWFAAPNTGKTLMYTAMLGWAIKAARVEPGNVFVFLADENSDGLAKKTQILDKLGAHSLAPGHKKLSAERLIAVLGEMVQRDVCRDLCLIIDTLKKVTSLMDKKAASTFTALARGFVAKGGTLLALSHINKVRAASGKGIPAGTSDFIDDFDAAYMIDRIEQDVATGETTIMFERLKSRGPSDASASYRYVSKSDMAYEDILASVERVSDDEAEAAAQRAQCVADDQVVQVVIRLIKSGIQAKKALMAEGAKDAKVSQKAVENILLRYAGCDADKHHWDHTVQAHGQYHYTLLHDDRF